MRRNSEKDKKLADDERLLRAWRNFHAEELAEALAGPHRHVLEPLMQLLETLDLHSSKALVAFIRAQEWSAIDAQTKFVVLHEINTAITKLRTRNGMAPIDDALWGERANVFQTIRLIIVPLDDGKPAEGILGTAAGRIPPADQIIQRGRHE
jgi:hypothetical protein